MMCRYLDRIVLIFLAGLLIVSCSRIQEPWVQNKDHLAQERMRTAEQTQELQNRLLRVQRDR